MKMKDLEKEGYLFNSDGIWIERILYRTYLEEYGYEVGVNYYCKEIKDEKYAIFKKYVNSGSETQLTEFDTEEEAEEYIYSIYELNIQYRDVISFYDDIEELKNTLNEEELNIIKRKERELKMKEIFKDE